MAFSPLIGTNAAVIVTANTTAQTITRPAVATVNDLAGISAGPNNVGAVNIARAVLISNASATIGVSVTLGNSTTLTTATTALGTVVPPLGTLTLHVSPDEDRISLIALSSTAIIGVTWGNADGFASG